MNIANNFRSSTGFGTATSDYSWSARMAPANAAFVVVGGFYFFSKILSNNIGFAHFRAFA
jgi:hypothetical protein